jgi:Zn-dependent M28 family amino/carboxypeptidase
MSDLSELNALADRLRRHVETLAATPRIPGTPEHRKALEYVRGHLQDAGLKTYDQIEDYDAGIACHCVLTEPLPGEDSLPLVIVGAHYDSIPGSPGADDNASAVAALIELASWIAPRLQQAPAHARLQLVAYDLEEYGLIGSAIHSRDVQKAGTNLRGMISLEMLAYTDSRPGSQRIPGPLAGLYPTVANFIGIVGNEDSRGLLQVVTAAMKCVPGLPVEFLAVPGDGSMMAETRLSDHSSFWDRGFPALMITDTSFFRNPHYHQASDTPETLDYPFLARVTMGVCEAVLRLLRAERLP